MECGIMCTIHEADHQNGKYHRMVGDRYDRCSCGFLLVFPWSAATLFWRFRSSTSSYQRCRKTTCSSYSWENRGLG